MDVHTCIHTDIHFNMLPDHIPPCTWTRIEKLCNGTGLLVDKVVAHNMTFACYRYEERPTTNCADSQNKDSITMMTELFRVHLHGHVCSLL